MHFPLTDAQQKQQIDAEQTYTAWQDAAARAREYAGGMHWKTIAGKEYLYKTLDRKGNAKSLGVRSDASEAIARQFNEHKALAKARLASLTQKYEGLPVPRPPHWGGFRLAPERIEFWKAHEFRLHWREEYVKAGEGWDRGWLNP